MIDHNTKVLTQNSELIHLGTYREDKYMKQLSDLNCFDGKLAIETDCWSVRSLVNLLRFDN